VEESAGNRLLPTQRKIKASEYPSRDEAETLHPFCIIMERMNTSFLFETLLNEPDLQGFLNAAAKETGNPMWIMDETYHVLAASVKPSARKYLTDFRSKERIAEHVNEWLDNGLLLTMAERTKPLRLHDSTYDADLIVADVIHDGRRYAKVTVILKHEMSGSEVSCICRCFAVYMRSASAAGSVSEQAFALLLQKDEASEKTGLRMLRDGGWKGKPPYRIVCVESDAEDRAGRLQAFTQAIKVMNVDIVMAIVSNRACGLLYGKQSLKRLLKKGLRAGYSLPFEKLESVYAYADQAASALKLSERKEVFFEDVEGEYIRHVLAERTDLKTLVNPAVRRMHDYDAAYETEYYRTLKTYYENGLSKQKTADCLKIHINTVKYRLSQVQNLFGLDPDRDLRVVLLSLLMQEEHTGDKH
jgi:hypothetical protein